MGRRLLKEAFWKYFAAVLGHGLVKYPQERDAYVSEKSNITGLYRNQFLCDLHTFEQWQHAKQIFVLPVGHLTNAFNHRTEALVTPTRYVTFLTFSFQTSFWEHIIFIFIKLISYLYSKIAIDEGGRPSWMDSKYRKYTPGKPHPNALEHFVAVDENGFAHNMVWPCDNTSKI